MHPSPATDLSTTYDRICERLDATGLGHREACRRAGINPDAIRGIRRAVEEGVPGRRGVSTYTIAALAPVLGASVDWLLDGRAAARPAGLPIVPWEEVGSCLDANTPIQCVGRYSAGLDGCRGERFATRAPDGAMGLLAPVGSYIIVDRSERALVEANCYVGLLDGCAIFRRWASAPDRAEPYSNDPTFRTEFLERGRRWEIVGRVVRAIIDV